MKSVTTLILVLIFGVGGMLFSGYLTYVNYWGPGCTETFISCGGSEQVLIFGQPTCVYGFGMFTIVAILSAIALAKAGTRRGILNWLLGLGIGGTLFAGTLSYIELYIKDIAFSGLPACVYGLIFYVLIFLAAFVGWRAIRRETPASQPPV